METNRFDVLTTQFASGLSRRRGLRLLAGLGAAAGIAADPAAGKHHKHKHQHQKKKKKKKKKTRCATTCPDGCCTGEHGTCIRPAQQSVTQCGTGGEICRSSDCPACTAALPCPAGQCCSGSGTCGACLVFVSSTGQNGNLGGLAGADAICQGLATAAGLPGPYLAWLSDTTGSPSSRFARATVPYTLVDGTTVAVNWSELTSGTLNHGIDQTETGGDGANPGNTVWTNTLATGEVHAVTSAGSCAAWTSDSAAQTGYIGASTLTTSSWTAASSYNCNLPLRLYCFQQH